MKYYIEEQGKHPLVSLFRAKDLGEDIWYDKGDEFVIPGGKDDGKYDVFAIRDGKIVGSRIDSKTFKLNNRAFKGLKLFGLFKKHAKLTLMAVYKPNSFSKDEMLTYGITANSFFEKDIKGDKVTLSCYFAIWPESISAQGLIDAKKVGNFGEAFLKLYKNSEKVARFIERHASNSIASALLAGEFNDLVKKNLLPNIPVPAFITIDSDDPRSMEFAKRLQTELENSLSVTGIKFTVKVLSEGHKPAGLDGGNKVFVATGRSLNSQYR